MGFVIHDIRGWCSGRLPSCRGRGAGTGSKRSPRGLAVLVLPGVQVVLDRLVGLVQEVAAGLQDTYARVRRGWLLQRQR